MQGALRRTGGIFSGLVAGLLGVVSVAAADTSPLLLVSPSNAFNTTGSLTVTTDKMPKGWFNDSGDSLNRSKTDIRLVVQIAATDCSPAVTINKSSLTDGAFTPTLNPASHVNGWIWSFTLDLSAYRDHWHNLILCGGGVQVVGCQDPRDVTVTVTAFNPTDNTCRTYTDDNSQTVCASDSRAGFLASIQDPDEVQSCEETGCDIGACVSACQQTCNAPSCAPGDEICRAQKTACNQCCECVCKSETAGCTPQDLCYTGSPGHAQCLER